MKLISFFLLFSLFFPNISAAKSDTSPSVDWATLKSAFQEYADYPTGDNAQKVIALLPSKHINYTGAKDEKETFEFIYDGHQLGMLKRQVISCDRQAVRLAFKLKSIADGGFSSDLNIILGTLIRINPKLFLEGLNEYQGLFNQLNKLTCNEGYPYVDRLKAQCYEMQLRIESLSKINDPKLKSVRDKSVSAIRESINRYCNDV